MDQTAGADDDEGNRHGEDQPRHPIVAASQHGEARVGGIAPAGIGLAVLGEEFELVENRLGLFAIGRVGLGDLVVPPAGILDAANLVLELHLGPKENAILTRVLLGDSLVEHSATNLDELVVDPPLRQDDVEELPQQSVTTQQQESGGEHRLGHAGQRRRTRARCPRFFPK